jgi:hypothetical protein
MPWRECSVMDEGLQFVARRLAGEAMAELCREFGISRKTGYKIFDRYQEWWAWVDLNHQPRPYQGFLWCYMHSIGFSARQKRHPVRRSPQLLM